MDVAHTFRNLRVDPADSLKFGINLCDAFYIDVGIAFGWTHRIGIVSDFVQCNSLYHEERGHRVKMLLR